MSKIVRHVVALIAILVMANSAYAQEVVLMHDLTTCFVPLYYLSGGFVACGGPSTVELFNGYGSLAAVAPGLYDGLIVSGVDVGQGVFVINSVMNIEVYYRGQLFGVLPIDPANMAAQVTLDFLAPTYINGGWIETVFRPASVNFIMLGVPTGQAFLNITAALIASAVPESATYDYMALGVASLLLWPFMQARRSRRQR